MQALTLDMFYYNHWPLFPFRNWKSHMDISSLKWTSVHRAMWDNLRKTGNLFSLNNLFRNAQELSKLEVDFENKDLFAFLRKKGCIWIISMLTYCCVCIRVRHIDNILQKVQILYVLISLCLYMMELPYIRLNIWNVCIFP